MEILEGSIKSLISNDCFNTICFSNVCINQPELIPTCIAALIIGIFFGNKLSKEIFKGNWLFTLVFYMYGTMMTVACIQQ
jgi:hypothetical protein